MAATSFLFVGLMAANFPLYRSLRGVFFEDRSAFARSMASLFRPNIFDFFREREEMLGEFKGFGFLMTCMTLVVGQFLLLRHFLLA